MRARMKALSAVAGLVWLLALTGCPVLTGGQNCQPSATGGDQVVCVDTPPPSQDHSVRMKDGTRENYPAPVAVEPDASAQVDPPPPPAPPKPNWYIESGRIGPYGAPPSTEP